MTDTLYEALAALPFEYGELVFTKDDGDRFGDREAEWVMVRICRRAGLPERKWHVLRHTFATHSALFGVNPWTLMQRLGHRDIEQTMRYVHLASDRRRELHEALTAAGDRERDPDRRILAMLSARVRVPFEGKPLLPVARPTPRLVSLAEWRRNRVAAGRCRDCGQARGGKGATRQRCGRCAEAERRRARDGRGKGMAKTPSEGVANPTRLLVVPEVAGS